MLYGSEEDKVTGKWKKCMEEEHGRGDKGEWRQRRREEGKEDREWKKIYRKKLYKIVKMKGRLESGGKQVSGDCFKNNGAAYW
jgi:hypothetical protein